MIRNNLNLKDYDFVVHYPAPNGVPQIYIIHQGHFLEVKPDRLVGKSLLRDLKKVVVGAKGTPKTGG